MDRFKTMEIIEKLITFKKANGVKKWLVKDLRFPRFSYFVLDHDQKLMFSFMLLVKEGVGGGVVKVPSPPSIVIHTNLCEEKEGGGEGGKVPSTPSVQPSFADFIISIRIHEIRFSYLLAISGPVIRKILSSYFVISLQYFTRIRIRIRFWIFGRIRILKKNNGFETLYQILKSFGPRRV